MSQRYSSNFSLSSTIIGLLLFVLVVYGLFTFAAFTIKTLISGFPIFLLTGVVLGIAAYFIQKDVPINHLKGMKNAIESDPIRGILQAALNLLFAPFIGIMLLGKAFFYKKIKTAMGPQGDFAQKVRDYQQENQAKADDGFTEVKRDDGLVIRIPKKDE